MSDDDFLDFDANGDDPFSDFDTDDAGGATDSTQPPPTRSLEEFDALVDRNIKTLMNRKQPAAERIEAAEWLGESGAFKSITALSVVYRKDNKNRAVQQAAGAALAKFKALDRAIVRDGDELVAEALVRPENDHVLQRLMDIALYEKTASRSLLSRLIPALTGLLVVSLLVMGVALLSTSSGTPSEPDNTPEPDATPVAEVPDIDPQSVINTLSSRVSQLRADVFALQPALAAVQGGGSFSCTLTLAQPNAYDLPDNLRTDIPALAEFVDAYNTQQTVMTTDVYEPINALCSPPATPGSSATQPPPTTITMSAADARMLLSSVEAVQAALPDVEAQLAPASEAVTTFIETAPTPTPTEEPTAAVPTEDTSSVVDPTPDDPTPVEESVVEPTQPTFSFAEINSEISSIRNVIDEATGLRGYNTLLAQYWVDVENAGNTGGCATPRPPIPDDYVVTNSALLEGVPGFAPAVEQVNVGLALSRSAWDLFERSCADGTLTIQLESGKIATQTAQTAFDVAESFLDSINP